MDAEDKQRVKRLVLQRRFTCPICGTPMTHYRLRGYKCHNENHNEQVATMTLKEREALYDKQEEN